jgi:SAM-dependent methyltransferase
MFRQKDRERCHRLFEKYYSGRKFKDALYRDLIWKHLPTGGRLLDAGCGRYLKFSKELAGVGEVTGIDLESTLETRNEGSPFGVRGDLDHLPFASGYFDLVISRSVVEHLENPGQVFREFCRVMKPGGKVILLTPNKYDYVSLIAAMTPYWVHRWLVSRIFRVPADDVFPTLYRANTVSSIRRELKAAGLKEVDLQSVNHYPAYLMFSPVLFYTGLLYERLTSLKPFVAFRGSLLCTFEKESASKAAPRKKYERLTSVGCKG